MEAAAEQKRVAPCVLVPLVREVPGFQPQPKPARGSHKSHRKALRRRDVALERELKKKLLVRDRHACRYPGCRPIFRLELAHLWEWKRSKTREKPPEERHTSIGACILCLEHHRLEEARRLILLPRSDKMADGPVMFVLDGVEVGTS